MANARMYLRCNGCKKAIMISRHYGEPWALDRDVREIDSFFRRHYECLLPGTHCSHDDDFSIVYDNGEEEYTVEYTAFEKVPDYVQEDIRKYEGEYEEDNKWLLFFVQGTLGDAGDVIVPLEKMGIKCDLLPEVTRPLMGGSMISFKCTAPNWDTFYKMLDLVRRHPSVGGICSKSQMFSKIKEGEE